jgi:hypothetical protein
MVCQQLDQLEWDFIQARAESRDIDSLGGQIVSFHASTRYSITSARDIKANAASGTKYHSWNCEASHYAIPL